jgi:hypothetical protein
MFPALWWTIRLAVYLAVVFAAVVVLIGVWRRHT